MFSPQEIERIREDFPVLKEVVHLASAATTPMPLSSIRAIQEAIERMYLKWDRAWAKDLQEECKKSIGRLVNADSTEIALISSTTQGINAIASGISWRQGDNLVIDDLEYPANALPWYHQAKKRGVEVRVVRNRNYTLQMKDFSKLIDENTRVVAVSHVQFVNGFRIELKELSKMAHEVGALLFVDAIQSLGAVRVDVREFGIDAMSAGGYKWLCGPIGTGLLYVKKEVIEEINPAYMGFDGLEDKERGDLWSKVVTSLDYVRDYRRLSKNAKRFEYGYKNPALVAGLKSSVEYLLGVGIERIESRISYLVDYLLNKLEEKGFSTITPREKKYRAGIVNFNPGIDLGTEEKAEKLTTKLREEGAVVTVRGGGIRVCCHFFNTTEDIDRFFEALGKILASK